MPFDHFNAELTTSDGNQPDIWTRLLQDRIVYIGQEIDENVANIVIAQLFFLE